MANGLRGRRAQEKITAASAKSAITWKTPSSTLLSRKARARRKILSLAVTFSHTSISKPNSSTFGESSHSRTASKLESESGLKGHSEGSARPNLSLASTCGAATTRGRATGNHSSACHRISGTRLGWTTSASSTRTWSLWSALTTTNLVRQPSRACFLSARDAAISWAHLACPAPRSQVPRRVQWQGRRGVAHQVRVPGHGHRGVLRRRDLLSGDVRLVGGLALEQDCVLPGRVRLGS